MTTDSEAVRIAWMEARERGTTVERIDSPTYGGYRVHFANGEECDVALA